MKGKRLAKKRKLPQSDASSEGKKKSKNGAHKQNNGRKSSDNDNSSNLDKIFERVALRRMKEIELLKPALVRAILVAIRTKTGIELSPLAAAKSLKSLNTNKAAFHVRKWLISEYKTIANEDADPDKRRTSWETVNAIFRMIDSFLSKDGGHHDESDTNGHAAAPKKVSASASTAKKAATASEGSTPINGNKTAEKASHSTAKVPAKPTGKTNTTSGDGKKAASASRAATQSSATTATTKTTATTTSTAQKSAASTTTRESTTNSSAISTAKSASKTTAPSNSTTQKNVPARTLASLTSASAMTTATALDSNNPTTIPKNNKKDPPTGAFVPRFPPPSAAPPPYEKRSLTTLQHKNDKLQKQQQNQKKGTSQNNSNNNAGSVAKKKTVAQSTTAPSLSAASSNLNSATVASSSTPVTTPSMSSSNTNGNADKAKSNISTIIPEVKENPIDTKKTETISLPQDPMSVSNITMYGNFVKTRPSVELQFKCLTPTVSIFLNCQRRLAKWDPHWVVDKNFGVGVTSPVTSSKYTTPSTYDLHTAARFAYKDLVKYAGPRIRQVQSMSTPPTDSEYRVLIRMIPLYLWKQKDGGKNRADVHLWPKGTYLNIKVPSSHNLAVPQAISQRKQQSHAPEKWLGICKHLDITSFVHQAYSSTQNSLRADSSDSFVQLGCYDKELYMFSLDLCRYRSPQTLYNTLLQSSQLRRVGLDEMQQRAKKLMENNEVVLDSDSEDENHTDAKSSEQKSIRFSIRDPLTLATLKTPVRGRECKHFSCFDLCTFLDLNKSPSGQRWKCGHCENFLSFEDLEHCALTEKACVQFGKDITTLQHMVEFKMDGSMALCKPIRSHQERARAKKMAAANETNGKEASNAEVVELLDSDSD